VKLDPKIFWLVLILILLRAFEENTTISSRYFFKKEGFYKPFVVLILKYKKLEKN